MIAIDAILDELQNWLVYSSSGQIDGYDDLSVKIREVTRIGDHFYFIAGEMTY